MSIYRSNNDIIIALIEYLRLSQPQLDTKPGTVARDLFVDTPAREISILYSKLQEISGKQSLFSSSGTDLSRLASNFGLSKNTGTNATGVATFTTNSIDSDILIRNGAEIMSRNGMLFRVTSDYLVSETSKNVYRATAVRLREELDLAGITDEFAVQVPVAATVSGASGNVGPYSLISHNILGMSFVTNLKPFSGGTNPENDSRFRSRILSVFAGSNTGTLLGYRSAVESVGGVVDSEVVVSGDPLLIRDGTVVGTDASGNLIVSKPGTGGKVDIYVLGSRLQNITNTYIYSDKSGRKDPTDPRNDFVLGQISTDTDLNISQRRLSLIGTDAMPNQPARRIISLAGSSSGSNFIEKYVDENGIIRGNYELIKDTGDFGGSSFGFDRLRWVSNEVDLSAEEVIKGTYNGIDGLDYTGVNNISGITRNVAVTNENSDVDGVDRSFVYLRHTPARNVSRVLNITTGERYVVEDQNPDGLLGEPNLTGRIKISGKTLPVSTDTLQVDYVWVKLFDRVYDFDNLSDYNRSRTAQDSVDWGFGNLVQNEIVTTQDGYAGPTALVRHNISKVIYAYTYSSGSSLVEDGMVLAPENLNGVLSVRRISDGVELYNTDSMTGSFSGARVILPPDSGFSEGDFVNVWYNQKDVFFGDDEQGGFFGKEIYFAEGSVPVGTTLLVSYVSDYNVILPNTELSLLPIVGYENNLMVSGAPVGMQPITNLYDGVGNIIKNLRVAPTNLCISVGSVPSAGQITVLGSTIKKVSDAIVKVTSGAGNTFRVDDIILSDLGKSVLPAGTAISRVYSVEKISSDFGQVAVENKYDIVNYKIKDSSFDSKHALEDSSLLGTQVVLPATPSNLANPLVTGDVLRVTFYYVVPNDSEILFFSRSSEQITIKKFSFIERVYVSYGFLNTASVLTGNISVRSFNQPTSNQAYSVDYQYQAPKENERITINYTHNGLINDISNHIEAVRPITADVLIKEAKEKPIDVSIRIVLYPEYSGQETTVLQDASDAVASILTASGLGTTLDSSDVVNALYAVRGIDRVRIIQFKDSDAGGNVLSIKATKNQYLSAGNIDIQVEKR